MTTDAEDRAKRTKLLLLDVDGVLTDGRLYYCGDGSEIKTFNTLDGHGIKLLKQSGVEVGIITGRESAAVANRAAKLGITLLIQGREDKYVAMTELLANASSASQDIVSQNIASQNAASHNLVPNKLTASQIAFMGDDYPDLTVMCHVGLALSVPNAHEEVKKRAHWVSMARGGEGAVREACDLIMKAQGTFSRMLEPYISPNS